MKSLILIFGCFLLLVPCQAAENQSEQNQQQLEAIDKYISQRRLEIEKYYTGQYIELNQRVQSEMSMLEIADDPVYACLAAQAEVAEAMLLIDSYGYQVPWYLAAETERVLQLKYGDESSDDFKDSIENSPKRYAVSQSLIAERKSRLFANLEWEVVQLEQRKQYTLTTGLELLKKQLREDVLRPKPKQTLGVVEGILYSADKPSAAINRKIVHQGDTIQGIMVVKIYKDKVAFEKNGKKWEQKVRQKPAALWK